MESGSRRKILVVAVVICLSFLHVPCVAGSGYSFVTNATDAPVVLSGYDYIIVGGGTAGCPLAATLSQNFSVLILERGGSPYGNADIENAYNFGKLVSNNGAVGKTGPPSPVQSFQSEDGVFNRRARVLGGGSSINAGFYSHASAEFVLRAGWDAGKVAGAYSWVESVVAFFPLLHQWQNAVKNALLEVGVLPDNGYTFKHLTGTKVGGSIFDEAGKRHTAADLLQYANPANITVLLYANVHKIIFSSPVPGAPRAIGVLFKDDLGVQHQAYLRVDNGSEVLVAAGAIGSPQLMMLSGVGDPSLLTPLNIPVILSLPGVGKGMADNPTNAIYVPSPSPVEISLIQIVGITSFGSFIEAASGAQSSLSQVGSLAMLAPEFRSDALVTKYTAALGQLPRETQEQLGQAGIILEKVDGPVSTGELMLNTTNVEDNPLVRFNYYSAPEDLYTCIEGTRVVQRLLKSKAMENFTYATLPDSILTSADLVGNLVPESQETDILAQWCKDTVATIWHYHGGSQVGSVVDDQYRVVGAAGLRIIDGSTFDSSPGTNPQATVMMLGRYMGVQILEERFQSTCHTKCMNP